MAQFSYADYQAKQEANQAAGNSYGAGPEVHFMNEYLKNDGDIAVVRFPYHSMADIQFETTHSVTFPGRRYPSRVRCDGSNCALCAQGVKLDTRFFAKAIVYEVDEASGNVKLINAVWDRPSAFADIDIKNLMQEYGDISQQLFKIRRNGTGTATRYTISIIMNATVYNPAVYKADFSELDKVDAARILSKSLAQYQEALNPGAAANPSYDTPTTPVVTAPSTMNIPVTPTATNAPIYTAPQQNAVPTEPQQTPVTTTSNQAPVNNTSATPGTRIHYQF